MNSCVSSEHGLRALRQNSAPACWLSEWSAVTLRQLLLLACVTGFAQQGANPLTVLSVSCCTIVMQSSRREKSTASSAASFSHSAI